jgi:uncharacterized protein
VILLDSNIFMYAAGAPHPHKAPSVALLERIADGQVKAGIDAEVLQEILHRYRAIGRWSDGRRVYDLTKKIIETVIPIDLDILDAARALMDLHETLGARDALHAAACQRVGATALCSYDKDFEVIVGLKRLEPPQVP